MNHRTALAGTAARAQQAGSALPLCQRFLPTALTSAQGSMLAQLHDAQPGTLLRNLEDRLGRCVGESGAAAVQAGPDWLRLASTRRVCVVLVTRDVVWCLRLLRGGANLQASLSFNRVCAGNGEFHLELEYTGTRQASRLDVRCDPDNHWYRDQLQARGVHSVQSLLLQLCALDAYRPVSGVQQLQVCYDLQRWMQYLDGLQLPYAPGSALRRQPGTAGITHHKAC